MDNYLGQIIGNRYEVQDIIGIGGMSLVYKAYDRVDDRVVAVKILKDEFLANEEFRLRFKNESKAIAVLSHPNIVKVYDVSFGETLQYLVMEYVEGITLKEYIERQGSLDTREAVHFVVQILRALQHAHDKGIIHRDIKPQNIMLLSNATIKVADFGIARFSRAESRNINETSAIGSVHYISPEQARGDYTDGRADIYSVGVVLYEMLTGQLPFDSENDISVAIMQMQDEAVHPRVLKPSIPVGLEQIVLRAMQKDPADRYQSAAEFLLDLDEFKRNPAIHFDYGYFIDQQPTRYLNTDRINAAAEKPVHILDDFPEEEGENYDFREPADYVEDDPGGFDYSGGDDYPPEPLDEGPYLADDAEAAAEEQADAEEKRNMLRILVRIAIGFVAAVVLLLLVAFGRQFYDLFTGRSSRITSAGFFENLDLFGWFSKDKIEVPNFINMKFEDVEKQYPELIFAEPESVFTTDYEPGVVFEQSPDPGTKVKKNTVIKLTIATDSGSVKVKDVRGMNFKEAETELKALGFTVVLVPEESADVDKDLVINTKPSPNTYLEAKGTVIIYYSTSAEGDGVLVPDVVGDQLAVARQKITAAKLKVGTVTESASSPALKGYVIGQDPEAGDEVDADATVNLIVGNGVPATATASLSVYLPNRGGVTGTVRTVLNGSTYDMSSSVKLDGSAFSLSFTGSGEDNSFEIYVDSTKIYSGKIDFTTEPPTISELTPYTDSSMETVPDVTGMQQSEAVERLKTFGFTNVKIERANSDTEAAGVVLSQSPASSSETQYATTTVITLIVSDGPAAVTTTEPDTTPRTTQEDETRVAAE